MSYRRGGKGEKEKHRAWNVWIQENAEQVAAAGLPEFVVQDEAHWWDFLMHGGHVEHHATPWSFTLRDLNTHQLAELLRLLLKSARERPSYEYFVLPGLIASLLDASMRSSHSPNAVGAPQAEKQLERAKGEQYHRGDWQAWLRWNRHLLEGCGVPAEVFTDEEEWRHFVGWELLARVDPPEFALNALSPREKLALLRLLMLWNPNAYLSPPGG